MNGQLLVLKLFFFAFVQHQEVHWTLQIARFLAPLTLWYAAAKTFFILAHEKIGQIQLKNIKNHTIVCGLGEMSFHFITDVLNAGEEVVTVHIHISKLNTLSDLNNIDFFTEIQREHLRTAKKKRKSIDLIPFNLHEQAARLIYSKYSPDAFIPIRQDSEQPHVLIIGFNQLGKSLLIQAARMSHFANHKKLKITVLEKGANATKRLFMKLYPQLHNVIDIDFQELNIDSFDVKEFNRIQGDLPVICSYLCLDGDKFSISYIRLVIPLIKDNNNHVVVCMKNSDNVFSVMPKKYKKKIHSFLLYEETCTKKAILNETVDDLAKAIHNDYIAKQIEAGTLNPDKKASHREWTTLSQNFKDQNRSQADNILIIGGRLTPDKTPVPEYKFTDNKEKVELLAMMEHHRWCAHLWINGWKHGEQRDDDNKIHTDLIAYNQLSDEIKQYDRNAIIHLPILLKRPGKKIVRDS